MFEAHNYRRIREAAIKDFAIIVEALAGAPNSDARGRAFWDFVANNVAEKHGIKTLFGKESDTIAALIDEAQKIGMSKEEATISPSLYATLEDLALGLTRKEAAKKRNLTENTVKTHRYRLYKFLNAPGGDAHAVAIGYQKRILKLPK